MLGLGGRDRMLDIGLSSLCLTKFDAGQGFFCAFFRKYGGRNNIFIGKAERRRTSYKMD